MCALLFRYCKQNRFNVKWYGYLVPKLFFLNTLLLLHQKNDASLLKYTPLFNNSILGFCSLALTIAIRKPTNTDIDITKRQTVFGEQLTMQTFEHKTLTTNSSHNSKFIQKRLDKRIHFWLQRKWNEFVQSHASHPAGQRIHIRFVWKPPSSMANTILYSLWLVLLFFVLSIFKQFSMYARQNVVR